MKFDYRWAHLFTAYALKSNTSKQWEPGTREVGKIKVLFIRGN